MKIEDLNIGDVVTWGSKEYNFTYKGNGQGSCEYYLGGVLHTLPEDGLILVNRKKIMKLRDLKVGDKFYFLPIGTDEIAYTLIDGATLQWNRNNGEITSCSSKDFLDREVKLTTMNIIEVLQALQNGKKVRKKDWRAGHFLYLHDKVIRNQENQIDGFYTNNVFDEYWEEYVEPLVEVQLNSEYKAVLSKDKIKVGCQEFTYEKLDELVNASKKFRKT